jgi:hypothetical protein
MMKASIGGVAQPFMMAAGDAARQMAAAPKPESKPQPTGEAKPVEANRYRRMFGAILFKPASLNAKTYPNEDGSKSKKIASVLLEMIDPLTGEGSRTYLKGAIRAHQAAGAKKSTVQFGFFGAQNQGICLQTEDEQAAIEMQGFKSHICREYDAHRKANSIGGSYKPEDSVEIDVEL